MVTERQKPMASGSFWPVLSNRFGCFFLLRHWGNLETDALIARIRLVVIVLVLPDVLRDAFRKRAANVLICTVTI